MINVIHNKLKNIKQFTYLCLALFFLMSNWVYGADDLDLDKKFKKFTKVTQNIREKFNSLPAGTSQESIIVDAAIKEMDKVMAFVGESFKNNDIKVTTMTLTYITKSLNDINKLVPKKFNNDMSVIDMSAMPEKDFQKIMQITKQMQINKKEKLTSLVKNMTEIDKRGLNLFQVSNNLNDLGVKTLSFEEIAKAVGGNPSLKAEVLKSAAKGIKPESFGEFEKQINEVDLKEATEELLSWQPGDIDEEATKQAVADRATAELNEKIAEALTHSVSEEAAAAAAEGMAKAAAAEVQAAVAAAENAEAKADPNSEHYIPPDQE